ncbi:stage III sporulation protein AD [Lachnospiraceae bacterium ZAX-1]
MDILKIAMIGIAGTLLAVLLKSQKAEYELFVTMGACLCIFFFLISKLEIVLEAIERIQEFTNLNTKYVAILMKMIGITYVAEFSANLCKDAGYQAVASQIEMFGKLSILAISMPVLLALLETIGEFLN